MRKSAGGTIAGQVPSQLAVSSMTGGRLVSYASGFVVFDPCTIVSVCGMCVDPSSV
jgi:hypothetical protein